MPNSIEVTACEPSQLGAVEFNAFLRFVQEGGEVTAVGLEQRIRNAAVLIRAERQGTLAGVGAIKAPNKAYRDSIFAKAESPHAAADFERELGWFFVSSECRGLGISKLLVAKAIGCLGQTRVYATSRADNAPMHRSLASAGFESSGRDFLSDDKKRRLRLFCR